MIASPELAGIHFTGSTEVFQGMWKTMGDNIATYRTYPRVVGETGGKNFVFAHPSADVPTLVTALVRGAFEYQGQKCSAASRALRSQVAVAGGALRRSRKLATVEMGDVHRLPQLHGRGHRPAMRSSASRHTSTTRRSSNGYEMISRRRLPIARKAGSSSRP